MCFTSIMERLAFSDKPLLVVLVSMTIALQACRLLFINPSDNVSARKSFFMFYTA